MARLGKKRYGADEIVGLEVTEQGLDENSLQF